MDYHDTMFVWLQSNSVSDTMCVWLQANSVPAAVSALSAATPAASSAKPKGAARLRHAATAPATAAASVDSPQDDLQEAAAESQPCPEDHMEPMASTPALPQVRRVTTIKGCLLHHYFYGLISVCHGRRWFAQT